MIFDLLRLNSGMGPLELSALIQTAPRRYKTYLIDKRSGGVRRIAQPAREVKALQYILLNNFLQKLSIHECAFAYVSEKGIRSNAEVHRSSDYILKLDFSDFFGSIKPRDFNRALKISGMDVDVQERRILHKVLFWGDGSYAPTRLSIGAPTSPLISNAVMFEIDRFSVELAKACHVKYTRYADDITVSSRNVASLIEFEKQFRSLIRRTKTPSLRFNEKKRGIYSRGERRMVTGLILTPDGNVSIGRERKREISVLIHHFLQERLEAEAIHRLHGLLSFAYGVEPKFIDTMNRKYGKDVHGLVSAQATRLQRGALAAPGL